ncbi:MAG: response regulator transcription factor [Burkholderiales bacterium]|nr:response regulator transcription factor [Burkholderiales bacterium]PZN05621.1 MAG: DNA-binding response regulator [Pseudomonadota bacterium]
MNPLRLLLVDDEAPARERLREVLGDVAAAVPHVVVGEAANGPAALAFLQERRVDLVLVDIHMPQMSGIEFARHVLRMPDPPGIIFVTAYDQHAVHAFEVNALDYLLKPVRAARLQVALQKARMATAEQLQNAAAAAGEARRFLSVSERGRILLVPLADVLYLKAELKYVTVRTREREYVIEESLTRLEQEFAELFVRIHRSCLVARRYLRGCERVVDASGEEAGWAVLLDGCEERLPVSRRQWPAVKALLAAGTA